MRLYLFERYAICFCARMAAALKRLHLQETIVLEEDSQTMMSRIGYRPLPAV